LHLRNLGGGFTSSCGPTVNTSRRTTRRFTIFSVPAELHREDDAHTHESGGEAEGEEEREVGEEERMNFKRKEKG
jgi:hypothetical protein